MYTGRTIVAWPDRRDVSESRRDIVMNCPENS
jgi:hypothetical protein